MGCTALRDDVACTGFTLTALSGNTQFKLDFVEAHASTYVTRYFAIRNTVANTDDHGNKREAGWLEKPSINANSSHY